MYLKMMNRLNQGLKYFLFVSLFTMLVVLFLQITLRYAFNYSLTWTAELARYLMIWITFVGAAIAVRHGRLIKVEILLLKMPYKAARWIEVIAGMISFSFYILLLIYGIHMLGTVKDQYSSALQISMAIPYAAVPVGALLMICNTIALIIDNGKGANKS
jgi:TRAP-type C4-dicarboxylate transport system permease small subunit